MDIVFDILKWIALIFFAIVFLKWFFLFFVMIIDGYKEKGFWGALLGALAWTIGLLLSAIAWIWDIFKSFIGLIIIVIILIALIRIFRSC